MSGLGFALALFAGWLLSYGDGPGWLAWASLIIGGLLMFAGFGWYIRAKGYNPAWALLFFLVGPLVFFVFFYLPDKGREKATGTEQTPL